MTGYFRLYVTERLLNTAGSAFLGIYLVCTVIFIRSI